MTGVVHIAGNNLQVNNLVRQRCAWCGAVLVDVNLELVAVPVGQDPTPPVWPFGGLVEVDGNVTFVVPHEDGAQLPPNACGRIDAAVTI